jgi:hypothetical protein
MSDEALQTGLRPVLNSTEAQLFVADIKTSSCDFYTGKLGFRVAFLYGDPPYYGQLIRDQARLNLRVVGEPVFIATFGSVSICSRRRLPLLRESRSKSCF